MRNYWFKILLGALGIFAVGMIGVAIVRSGVAKVNSVVHSDEPITIPLGLVPFAIAGERLRIVAALIRTTGDWDLAEDALADASERALERWTRDGIPDNPAAWLTTTAWRKAVERTLDWVEIS